VLLDNADNYGKDRLQRRVLSAGLNDGLLSAEGDQRRSQRRVVAPIFARRTVMEFAPAMMQAAENLVNRWVGREDGAPIEVAAEMSRLALEVLERSIFSDGLGRCAEDIRVAMATYFDTIGKISALDLVGAPDFILRLSRLRVGATLRDNLDGEKVEPGCLILVSPYVLHRHRRLWDQPDAFDPRRFLGAARSGIDRFA
jgi:cytochrome P450